MAGSETFTVGLNDEVSGPSKKAAAAAAKLEKSLARLQKARDRKSEHGLSALSVGIGNIGAKAFETGIALAEKFGKSILDNASLAGSAKLSFTALLGSEGAANNQIDIAIDKSKKYGLAIEDVIASQQRFMTLGFSAKQANTVQDIVADMRFLGATSETLERVSYDLAKIQSTGKLDGAEVRQLGKAGVPVGKVYQRIADNLGLVDKAGESAIEQVIKLKKKGQIGSEVALNSIGEVLLMTVKKEKPGEAAKEAAEKTVGGTIDRIGALMHTGMFEAVRRAEPALVAGLNSIFHGLDSTDGSLFADKLTNLVMGIADMLNEIGPKMPAIAENFVTAFGAASGFDDVSFSMFADALPQVATDMGKIAGNIAKAGEWIMKLLPYLDKLGFSGLGGDTGIEPASYKKQGAGFKDDPLFKYGPAASQEERDMAQQRDLEKYGLKALEGAGSAQAWDMLGETKSSWNMMNDLGPPSISDSAAFASHELNSAGDGSGASGQLTSAPHNFDAMASAAADSARERSSGGGNVQIDQVTVPITITGSGDPKQTAEHVKDAFEDQLGSHLDRLIQGNGAK